MVAGAQSQQDHWRCQICDAENARACNACSRCTYKPEPWRCPTCRQENWFQNLECVYCGGAQEAAAEPAAAPPPAPPPAPASAKRGGGDGPGGAEWSCGACTLLNPPARASCAVCHTPRPGAPQPSPGPKRQRSEPRPSDARAAAGPPPLQPPPAPPPPGPPRQRRAQGGGFAVSPVDPCSLSTGWHAEGGQPPAPAELIDAPAGTEAEGLLGWALDVARRQGRAVELARGELPFRPDRKRGTQPLPLRDAALGFIGGGLGAPRFCGALTLPGGRDCKAAWHCAAPHGHRCVALARDVGEERAAAQVPDGWKVIRVEQCARFPFRGFQGGAVLHDGESIFLLPASIKWDVVTVTEKEGDDPVTRTAVVQRRPSRISPRELDLGPAAEWGHGAAGQGSWAAWAGARAVRLRLHRPADCIDLLALMRRCGVRVLLTPPAPDCGGGCHTERLLSRAGREMLPPPEALGVPHGRADVHLAALTLLPHAAFSADVLGIAEELLQVEAGPPLQGAREALAAHLSARGLLQTSAELAAVARNARPSQAALERPALELTLTPSGAVLDCAAPCPPASRGLRAALRELAPMFPDYPAAGVVQVRMRDEDCDLPTVCGQPALGPAAQAFFAREVRVPLPQEAAAGGGTAAVSCLHWSQSQMKEGNLLGVLLPGLSAEDAARWVNRVLFDGLLRGHQGILRAKVPKRAARLSLFFSADDRRSLGELSYRVRPDIEMVDPDGGHVHKYTDGAGMIDAETLHARWRILQRDELAPKGHACPAVIQIRAAACKGTLQAVPGLRAEQGVDVVMTESMEKVAFEGQQTVEVFVVGLGTALPLHMNVQALQLLLSRGVPVERFLERASHHALAQVRAACSTPQQAWELLQADAPFICDQGPSVGRVDAASARIDPRNEPGLCSALLHVLRHRLRELKDKARFPVEAGRTLMMVPDFSGTLAPDEVFIQIRDEDSGQMQVIEGRVAALKVPALHPRDLRCYRGVRNAALESQGIFNAVVYSTQTGGLPAAETQGGADYDGDQGWVTWDPELLPPGPDEVPRVPGTQVDFVDALGNVKPLDYARLDKEWRESDSDPFRTMAALFQSVSTDSVLGQISTLHKIHSDKDGGWDKQALQLARLCAAAVDAPKTGARVEVPLEAAVPDELRPRYAQKDKRKRHQQERLRPQTVLERVYELARHYQGVVDTFIEDLSGFAGTAVPPTAVRPCVAAERVAAATEQLLAGAVGEQIKCALEAAAEGAERAVAMVMRRLWLRREAEFVTGLLENHGSWARRLRHSNAETAVLEGRRVALRVRQQLAEVAAVHEGALRGAVHATGLALGAGVCGLEPFHVVCCWFHVAMTARAASRARSNRRLFSLAWIPAPELCRSASAVALLGSGASPRRAPRMEALSARCAEAEGRLLGALKDPHSIHDPSVGPVASQDGQCVLQQEEALRILHTVAGHDVTIIVAPTGRGKSTLVPRLLMEGACSAPSGEQRVLVSQPRRVACKTLAERVASDVGAQCGGTVGYRVAGEDVTDEDETRLVYMTELLVLDTLLSTDNYSHIVLDEVHQATQNCDLLQLAARHLLLLKRPIKVVLMSATAHVDRLRAYMSAPDGAGRPRLTVGVERLGSHTHEVSVRYLDNLMDQAARGHLERDLQDISRAVNQPGWAHGELRLSGSLWSFARGAADALHGVPQLSLELRALGGDAGSNWLSDAHPRNIFAHLVASTVVDIHLTMERGKENAIVVFLPGKGETMDVMGHVAAICPGVPVFTCYGTLALDVQQERLNEAARSGRCFCFCTNLLESSVTFPTEHADPVVVDTLLEKRRVKGTLRTELISRSQADQRKGRTGRRHDGVAYRLATADGYGRLEAHPGAEEARLAEVVLRMMDREAVGLRSLRHSLAFLRDLPGRPDLGVLQAELDSLVQVRAIVREGADGAVRRTLVGELLRRQGMEPQHALLVVECSRYGSCAVLGGLAAAALRVRRPCFVLPERPRELSAALRMRERMAHALRSDLAPEMAAIAAFRAARASGGDLRARAYEMGLSFEAVYDAAGNYDELLGALRSIGLEGAVNPVQEEALACLFDGSPGPAIDRNWVSVFTVSAALAFAPTTFWGSGEADRLHPNNVRELKVSARRTRRRGDDFEEVAKGWLRQLGLEVTRVKPIQNAVYAEFQGGVGGMRLAKVACEKLQERRPEHRISQVMFSAKWQGQLAAAPGGELTVTESHLFPCPAAVQDAAERRKGPLFAAADTMRVANASGGGPGKLLASRLTRVPRGLHHAVKYLQAPEVGRIGDSCEEPGLRQLLGLERRETEALREAGDVAHAVRTFRDEYQAAREAAFRDWARGLFEDDDRAQEEGAARQAAARRARGGGFDAQLSDANFDAVLAALMQSAERMYGHGR